MKGHFLLATALSAVLSSLPSTTAWTLCWSGEEGNATIETGNGAQRCKQIDHAEGKRFSWDPKDGPWCLKFYTDDNCEGDVAGWACDPPWKKSASTDLSAFEVYNGVASSSSVSSLSPTSTATSASTAAAESTTTTAGAAAGSSSSGGSSLSGGAIAGIVVGVVAGVAIIGALAFFLGIRRRRRNEATVDPAQNTNAIPPPTSPGNPSMDKPMAWAQAPDKDQDRYRVAPGSRFVELPGDNTATELSDSHRVVELESPNTEVKRSIGS